MRVQGELTFAEEVRDGLLGPGQKKLPTKYLYDEVGSALFDAITALPEYGLTRADLRLLSTYASDIRSHCPNTSDIAELGSGNGSKTRAILSAFGPGVVYRPIDLSRAALDACSRELSDFQVEPIEADFLTGLAMAAGARTGGRMLIPFLGSNIGNFERTAIVPFLGDIRDHLRRGDYLLLGADLVKPVEQLMPAYDDPAGVTAAFNRNLLSRVNREFGGDFEVRCFEHFVNWNASERRIEMHLRSMFDQTVRLEALNLQLNIHAGETIWTESSHKFETAELIGMAERAGFSVLECWTDAIWAFAELLFRAE